MQVVVTKQKALQRRAPKGLQSNKDRGDCRSFEPSVQDYLATFLRPEPEVQIATRVLKLPA
jgi:hypothetical protein